jgi:hypothetical protein
MTHEQPGRAGRVARAGAQGALAVAGLAAGGYLTYTALAWARYGRARAARGREADALLDRFMPAYDVVERHHIAVNAPAEDVLAAAKSQELDRLPLIRGIFRMRQMVMGADEVAAVLPRALLPQMLALGWGVLAEHPGREVVVGAVTKPWQANVVFEALRPDTFEPFDQPGYVKIAWTLRADPLGEHWSMFRTETRAVATDVEARRRFRLYWSLASPGIGLIRWLSLRPLKMAAEERVTVQQTLSAEVPLHNG